MALDLTNIHNSGLPIILNNLLNQLLSSSEIKGWSIYENSGGKFAGLVNLNIRFSMLDNGDPTRSIYTLHANEGYSE